MSSQSSHPNSEAEKLINDDVTEILQKLTAAVQAGEKEQAAALVTELADLKLKLDINIPKEDQEQRSKEKEFSVRVHVEDRVSDGCYFNLKVKACDTVHDLKKKVMLKHNFPMEVQRWIVGKRFLVDKDRIGQCGIKKSGHTLYLYLVTARSVELTRQDYEARRQAMLDGRPLPMSQNSQPGGLSPVNKDSTFMLRSLWQPSELDGGYNAAELSPSPNYGMDEVESGLPHGPSRQTSKKSLSSGSSFLQGMLQSIPQTQNDALPAGVRQRSVSSDNGGGQGMDSPANDRTSPSSYRSVTPPHSPAHDTRVVENPGWYCPACTFLNLPTRPGCEMCSTPRPTNYHVPSGYQMTQKEKEQLENDQRLEKLTREAVPPAGPSIDPRPPPSHPNPSRPRRGQITFDQLSEQLQLMQALKAEDKIHERNKHIGNDLIYIPEGSNWANVQPFSVDENGHQFANTACAPPPTTFQAAQQQYQNAVAPSGSYHAPNYGGYVSQEPVQHGCEDSSVTSDEENSHA